ncbi:unnamed protein product, partial [Amoebophrya sp. A120]
EDHDNLSLKTTTIGTTAFATSTNRPSCIKALEALLYPIGIDTTSSYNRFRVRLQTENCFSFFKCSLHKRTHSDDLCLAVNASSKLSYTYSTDSLRIAALLSQYQSWVSGRSRQNDTT